MLAESESTESLIERDQDMDSVVASPMRERVLQMEARLLSMPQADIRTTHSFKPGIYERTITIPPWTVLTGAAHKTAYSVRLDKGTIAVNTDDGIKILSAPFAFDAPAGVKRIGRVFGEQVMWTDIYPNEDDCRDIEILESRLYDLEDCELGENRRARLISQQREDYQLFLMQLGLSEQTVWEISDNQSDQIPLPDGFDVEVRPSSIHGSGLFAKREFSAGEMIAPGRIEGKRTPVGRYMNHSCFPNAEASKSADDNLSAMAIRRIHENEEILIDYRNSMRINFGIVLQGETSCQAG